MDPASLALGIAALYTTCRDCYTFFTAVKTAEADSSAHLRELEIQQSILKAWGFHWQIHNPDGIDANQPSAARPKLTKLQKYFSSNRFKAEGVYSTLSALADTLSNQEKLIKRYGISLQPIQAIQDGSQATNNVQLAIASTTINDVKPVITEVKARLSMLSKCKWALKDKDNFKKLIIDLKSHSDSLYRLCPENAFESMNIFLTMECLARQESPVSLKWTSRIASEHAQSDETSSVRDGYELLASAATLKASVNENRDGTEASDKSLSTIDEEEQKMWYLGKGLALFEDQVVYVEMRDYRGPPLELTPEQKEKLKEKQKSRRRRARRKLRRSKRSDFDSSDDNSSSSSESEDEENDQLVKLVRPADSRLRALISDFFKTFQGKKMGESVYGLDIAGMIDHTKGEHEGHCSILYRLPDTIGVRSRERPAENLKLRAPVTLHSLLGDKYRKGVQTALGTRFRLAKKLVRAVCLLHSSGWLHKNIRAESVMFFPEHVNALQADQYDAGIEIDVSKPILMGYIFSRPDDIIARIEAPPEPQAYEISPVNHSRSLRMQSVMTQAWDDPTDEKAKSRRRSGTPHFNSIYGRDMLAKVTQPEETKETNISGFTLDYYQHPAKHADPQRLYRHAYDVYSLGILLLEIGLWDKLANYKPPGSGDEDEDHYERRRWVCKTYLERLRWSCGDTYANVVLSCLMIDSIDDEIAKASERELCARIVADLEGCQA